MLQSSPSITAGALALLALATLAGCATTGSSGGDGYYGRRERPPAVVPNPGAQQVHPLARSATFTCEDLTTVVLTEGQADARATLNSGLELGLRQLGAGRFGRDPYEFRTTGGSEGVWINQGKVSRCRMK